MLMLSVGFVYQIIIKAAGISVYLQHSAHVSSIKGNVLDDSTCVCFSFDKCMTNIERTCVRNKKVLLGEIRFLN